MSTSKALQVLPNRLPVVTDGLQSYLQQVNSIPLLTEEQERDLAVRFREQGDLAAAQQLVLSHLRYVAKVARMYTGYGLPVADLIQEGSIGLMKAVKRFDPNVGVRLVSFAVHWIKSEIHEFVIRNWRIVKVATTKAQRKLFFNLRGSKKRLGWFSAQEIQDVAKDLGVPASDVLEMEKRLNAHDASFDYPSDGDEDDNMHHSPVYYLAAPKTHEPTQVIETDMEDQAHASLHAALAKLDPRSIDIVSQRWLNDDKASLKILAEKYEVSIERIRQLEKAALAKIKGALEHAA
jgi:RNA polymerase sigma-32 factor